MSEPRSPSALLREMTEPNMYGGLDGWQVACRLLLEIVEQQQREIERLENLIQIHRDLVSDRIDRLTNG